MDIRKFINNLGHDVEVVRDPVNCCDIPRHIEIEEQSRNRAIVFENINDYRGRVAGNIFSTKNRLHSSLGVPDVDEFYRKINQAIAEPCNLDLSADGDNDDYIRILEPNLSEQIPQIIYSEHDATPYITSGIILARHPESGRHHVCFVRLSLQGGNSFLFNPRTFRIKEIAEKTLGCGEPLEIVVLIGAPPPALLSGGLTIPINVDELQFIQALGGSELKFYDVNLPVPARTELVMFGTVEPEIRQEGPFGDMRGFYASGMNPVCYVHEMWRRREDIYHTILGGMSHEHIGLVSLKACHALESIKSNFPGVIDYRQPQYAAGQLAVLRVKEDVERANLADALFKVGLVELFVLVNEDTDIDNPKDILWSLTQRTSDNSDFFFHDADSSRGNTSRTVIDATISDLSVLRNKRVRVYRK